MWCIYNMTHMVNLCLCGRSIRIIYVYSLLLIMWAYMNQMINIMRFRMYLQRHKCLKTKTITVWGGFSRRKPLVRICENCVIVSTLNKCHTHNHMVKVTHIYAFTFIICWVCCVKPTTNTNVEAMQPHSRRVHCMHMWWNSKQCETAGNLF